MTNDPNLYITVAVSTLAGLGMVTAASLSGWHSWLALKRQELAAYQPHDGAASASSGVPSWKTTPSRMVKA